MVTKANIHEAKTHFSKLLEKAHNGEEVVIAKDGKPYVRLVPISGSVDRTPGAFRGLIKGDVLGGVGPDDSDWG
jgi:prevent-host-death family protein